MTLKPSVQLIDWTKNPFNLSIASARTCYSSRGLIFPEEMELSEKSIEVRDRIAKSTKKAGHLTTRQHPQFIFGMDRVSRHFVWTFLHSHPFYNSEQVSQRYVEVKKENYYIPPKLNQKELSLYLDCIQYSTESYSEFIELLFPYLQKEYFSIYKSRADYPEKWTISIKKKCLEIARYLLPVATYTYLYHTINGLTLHRYSRLRNLFSLPEEQSIVVQMMIDEVCKIDPLFIDELDDPIPLENTLEYEFLSNWNTKQIGLDLENAKKFVSEFDLKIGQKFSSLVSHSTHSEDVLSDSIRAVLGLSSFSESNSELLELLLSPAKNQHLSSTLNETTLSPISRALSHVHYTFQKKISHTADSQDQRHRMTPASRPLLLRHYTGEPDYIIPEIIKHHPELLDRYSKKMKDIFQKINKFMDVCANKEYVQYLLPNAFPIRFYESGNLLNLYHKWKSRLCFNAQEEIFHASVQELCAIKELHPSIGQYIQAPCWIRYMGQTKPFCPEGDRYCGVQVWKKNIDEYRRMI